MRKLFCAFNLVMCGHAFFAFKNAHMSPDMPSLFLTGTAVIVHGVLGAALLWRMEAA